MSAIMPEVSLKVKLTGSDRALCYQRGMTATPFHDLDDYHRPAASVRTGGVPGRVASRDDGRRLNDKHTEYVTAFWEVARPGGRRPAV